MIFRGLYASCPRMITGAIDRRGGLPARGTGSIEAVPETTENEITVAKVSKSAIRGKASEISAGRFEDQSLTAFGVENRGLSAFRGYSLDVTVQLGRRHPAASRRLAQNPPTRGSRFQWRRSAGRGDTRISDRVNVPRCLVFRKRPARCCRVRGGLRASPACLFPDAFF
jgi:hypothetical protein